MSRFRGFFDVTAKV